MITCTLDASLTHKLSKNTIRAHSSKLIGFNQHTNVQLDHLMRRRGGLVVRASDSGARGRGFSLGSPCCILEQDTFTSQKSTGNTQEAVALSRHD